MGRVNITSNQAKKLTLKSHTRLSPFLEKCCLLLIANESFDRAEIDIKKLTGVQVSSSSQHRLLEKYEPVQNDTNRKVEALSVDGGKVRIRTPCGEASQWRDYKAVSLHEDICGAFFQNNQELLDWVNSQPLSRIVTCVGDGHDGVWNLIKEIGEQGQRREVLDWFHLMENLFKIEISSAQLKRIKNCLWFGDIESVFLELKTIKKSSAWNFQNYLNKHYHRLPDYSLYRQLNICIGSGSVESTIKRIGARIKIAGAQYLSENVSKYLKLRCAYLNGGLA